MKRPLKLLMVTALFAFLGVIRLRAIPWITADTWQLYLGYLASYVESGVLSGIANFAEIGYVTLQPLPNQWQNLPGTVLLSYESFRGFWYFITGIEIVIIAISFVAVYSTIALRRSYLAKIGSFTLIIAGILDPASPLPLTESVIGVISFYILLRPDVKEAFGSKRGTSEGKSVDKSKEVTLRADLNATTEKRKTGVRCPNCGLLLPPSAKVCRRCGKRVTS
jgi:ribosomal protein L40E